MNVLSKIFSGLCMALQMSYLLGVLLGVIFCFSSGLFLLLYTWIKASTDLSPRQSMLVVGFIYSLVIIILYYKLLSKGVSLNKTKKEHEKKIDSLNLAHQKETEALTKKYEDEIKAIISELDRQKEGVKYLFKYGEMFCNSASAAADMKAWMFEDWRQYLVHKRPPALRAAEITSELKSKVKIIEKEKKLMQYKYEFLLSTFPELRRYVDDEEALLSLSKEENFDNFKENRDAARDYLSDKEWKALSIDERNQLALDRYMQKGKKSKWTVGMFYEMYIGYYLQEKGFHVCQNGLEKGLEDLGRDVIAYKQNSKGGDDIYVIQCKNWSSNKEIHENVVCQIFGSAIEFEIQNKSNTLFQNDNIIPVICTTTALSETAMAFAKKLGVRVHVVEMGEFPVIKCNINNGNKIYHLPFDQQYWRTQIINDGEFYAWSVAEATSKGFRRAMKHQMVSPKKSS